MTDTAAALEALKAYQAAVSACLMVGGVAPNDTDPNNWWMMMVAAQSKGADVIRALRDADPLPDADGWEPKVGDRVKLVKDGLSTVGAVGMEGVIKEIMSFSYPYLIELDEGLIYKSHAVPEQYRLTRADRDCFVSAVRPAPSGPVVEDTVKRIEPPEMTLRDWFAGQALAGLLAGSHKMPGDSHASRAEERVVEAYAHADAMIRVKQGDEAMEGK